METTTPTHIPVLLEECLEILAPALNHEGAVYVDGTLGLGGHTEAFLDRFPGITAVGIDRDTSALSLAGMRLERFGSRFHGVHTTYDQIPAALEELGLDAADGILLDLGVSSMQLDEAERGFAYAQDAPLDMRMNQNTGITAAEVLASYSEADLIRIFRNYGEEKLAPRYARAIVAERVNTPIERSGHLVTVLNDATPYALRNAGHPAKRVFQALRIEVNTELEILRNAVSNALDSLSVGGRLAVLSYHSLEDRLVKTEFAARSSSRAPVGLPIEPAGMKAPYRLLFNGARSASTDEISRNSRAASVKFRAIERLEVAR